MMRVTYRRKSASGVRADTEISPDIRLQQHFEDRGEEREREKERMRDRYMLEDGFTISNHYNRCRI